MFKGQILPRTTKVVNAYQNLLNERKVPFTIKHGTYTTKIIHPNGVATFSTTRYSRRVFIAFNKVKEDVLKSEFARHIMQQQHFTENYNSNKLLPESFYANQILNIDINQAYATCLYVNKIISKETYDYIQSLPKSERLVCVGMLAKGYTEFEYKDGECVKVSSFREPTAQVFFYVIQEINYLMNDMKFFLGNDFVMYWVDGIFFNYKTPLHKIKEAEEVLLEQGYRYKYEDCKEFDYRRQGAKIVVDMMKNGHQKHLEFKTESKKDILTSLYEKAKNTANKIHDGGITGLLQESWAIPFNDRGTAVDETNL